MGLINPITLAGFIVGYSIIGIVSAISIMAVDAGPQAQLINTAFAQNELQIDTSLVDADNAIEVIGAAPGVASNHYKVVVQSLTFQAPIWQYSWAKPISYVLMALMVAYLLAIGFFGLGLVLRVFGR